MAAHVRRGDNVVVIAGKEKGKRGNVLRMLYKKDRVVIERVMVHRLGRWGYQPWHPLVPVLGVGLFPVLQPIVLLPLVFWGLAWIEPSAERTVHDSRSRVQGESS